MFSGTSEVRKLTCIYIVRFQVKYIRVSLYIFLIGLIYRYINLKGICTIRSIIEQELDIRIHYSS